MGLGKEMSMSENEKQRNPHAKPPFTLGDLRRSIPVHCFQRSLRQSAFYMAADVATAALLYRIATAMVPLLSYKLQLVAWPTYWAAQGCVFTGIWVIAHECGHHAFSDHEMLDDLVGYLLHSFLLVPYFSWKFSHRRHHSNNASIEKDEVFVPKPKEELAWPSKLLNNTPGRVVSLVFTLLLGWPFYLSFNVSGRHYSRFACHFDPYSPIFNDRERWKVFISDAAVAAVGYLLYVATSAVGLARVMAVYGFPLLIANGFLVTITFLQHTHAAVPHYDSSEWDWLIGSLATVDREYGPLNRIFHHITDTHVVHHLFSTIPHYHAAEATAAIKPVLGKYYLFDRTPFYKALWREAKECLYVEPDHGLASSTGVFWYRNTL